jgi:hypothetical protein
VTPKRRGTGKRGGKDARAGQPVRERAARRAGAGRLQPDQVIGLQVAAALRAAPGNCAFADAAIANLRRRDYCSILIGGLSMSKAAIREGQPGLSGPIPVGALVRAVCAIALLAAIAACSRSTGGTTGQDVVVNGNLSAGSNGKPDGWTTRAYQLQLAAFDWQRPPGSPAELVVINSKPNDAYWLQAIHLGAGWYHFTAEMRTENVGGSAGATLCVPAGGITSRELNGTTDWQTVGFYLKAGTAGADVELTCRLGGFASLNTGKGFCRNIKGITVDAPVPGDPAFDLDVINGPAK